MSDETTADPTWLLRCLLNADWSVVGGRYGAYVRVAPPGKEGDRRAPAVLVPLDVSAPDFADLMAAAVADALGRGADLRDARTDTGGVAESARCPECGEEIQGFDFTAGVFEVTHGVEPAWEGGPLVWVPLPVPQLRPDPARDLWTAKPCGHRVKRKDVWVRVTRAGGGGEGACRG